MSPMRAVKPEAADYLTLAAAGLATLVGARNVAAQANLAPATRAYFVVSLAAGLLLLLCGVLAILGTRKRLALAGCMALGALLFANQALGLVLKTIPCSSPG